MRFESMQEFIVLSEVKNYYEAAEQLYISESTLSRHIRDLELEVGGALFSRSTRQISLTVLGTLFLPYAQEAVDLQKRYLSTVQNYLTVVSNTINIGFVANDEEPRLNDAILTFKRTHPDARFNIIKCPESEALQLLDDKISNITIIREVDGNSPQHKYSRKTCYSSRFSVYMSKKHPFADRDVLSINDLRNECFILPHRSGIAYNLVLELCAKEGYEPTFAFNGVKQSVMLHALSNNYGIALLFTPPAPYNEIESEFEALGVCHVDLDAKYVTDVNIVYAETRLNPLEQAFVQHLASFY